MAIGDFSWASYAKAYKITLAPKHLFTTKFVQNVHVVPKSLSYGQQCGQCVQGTPTHLFRKGMKLEAVDRKDPSLVCVASVGDVMENRFLIHFDGWDDIYDYWVEADSPYIHPVNWCLHTGHILTPPNNFKDPENFTWEQYLKATKSEAAPLEAFLTTRAAHKLEVGMRFEAVDRRNPGLIRVASVAETQPHSLKLHFDGWDTEYDYWVDHDSSELHPIKWCSSTGHCLEPPPNPQETSTGPCPTRGCRGVGHIKGPQYVTHLSLFGCPYSPGNMSKETAIQDRLGPAKGEAVVAQVVRRPADGLRVSGCPMAYEKSNNSDSVESSEQFSNRRGRKPKTNKLGCIAFHGVYVCVQKIDGESFLMLSQADLVNVLRIKLGPALKIFNAILYLRQRTPVDNV
ncbi:ICK [Cordylochernes scorpioides]|uniref:ICK n=1 Tax=Cordylochernes scorpioides TaxID=51811 RepID=A0ABY6K198_9ARAC|nr:ICK [Cordylochernes scorpioides]